MKRESTVPCKAQRTVHNINWNGLFEGLADNLELWEFDKDASLGLIRWLKNPG